VDLGRVENVHEIYSPSSLAREKAQIEIVLESLSPTKQHIVIKENMLMRE
jgi:hypothetical protein